MSGTAEIYETHYTYDASNNRTQKRTYHNGQESGLISYSLNALNQVVGTVNNGAEETLTYGELGGVTGYDGNTFTYDGYGRISTSAIGGTEKRMNYDYRGRKTIGERRTNPSLDFAVYNTNVFSGSTSVMEFDEGEEVYFHRGPDMGGGVGGLNYSEKADGSSLNYKYFNLRGDVIATSEPDGDVLSQSRYEAFAEHIDAGTMPPDKYRGNTKREEDGLLNEGHRYRSIDLGVFMSPDPLEYVDGPNCYVYCNQNPWGRFDLTGLEGEDISGIRAWGWVGHTAYSTNPGTPEQQEEWRNRAATAAVVSAGGVKAAAVTVAEETTGIPISIKDIAKGILKRGREVVSMAKSIIKKPTNKNEGASVYRYVTEGEAIRAKETGFIPTTNAKQEAKEVFVTPSKIQSATEAEKRLQIGKYNPEGATDTPTYRITGDATGVPFNRAGKVAGGNATELVTTEKIPVKKVEKLKE